jgi:hypothetical protein
VKRRLIISDFKKGLILNHQIIIMMNDIKQYLINKISTTDDENLLLLLKADYEYFTGTNKQDVTDDLSEDDKQELINLVSEPFGFDTISQELDEAIRQWRIK